MTADMSSSYSEAPPARQSGLGRTVMAVLGIAAVLVGGVLLFNPFAAAALPPTPGGTIRVLPVAGGAGGFACGGVLVNEKEESGGRTITRIEIIEGEERRRELARMLSGRIDEASLAHASELLVGGR